MSAPVNTFKQALKAGEVQYGAWLSLGSPFSAELMASRGYDWLVIDNEHAPNTLATTLPQIQAIHGHPCEPVVRPPIGEDWMIKQFLDGSARTLLIPMVEDAAQAEAMVRATRYPPHGIRGVGASVGRATFWGATPDYFKTAEEQLCLLLQVESRNALENLDAIAATEGVDGVFIGPADLSADMGHLGDPTHPEVLEAIGDAIGRIRAAGKAPGILWPANDTQRWIDKGALFCAIGSDAGFLGAAAGMARGLFKE
ncbi:HpcH/HpaI aldolase family protein [Rhodovulum sp. DZ06]|uniref:HpcH/HpaI aldolase family protein n=1 Tax=Rhodovulum sp. DZ06 TaxID=3425126 RepID=UPI003D325432